MSLLTTLLLALSPAAHAAPSPALAGLGTTAAGVVGAGIGGVAGWVSWTALDSRMLECPEGERHCGAGPVYRGIFFGGPLGATLGGYGGAALTHGFAVGGRSRGVLVAGAATALGGMGLATAGVLSAKDGGYEAATALYLAGSGVAVLGTPVVMGVASGRAAAAEEADAQAAGPRVHELGWLMVEDGGGVRVGGTF